MLLAMTDIKIKCLLVYTTVGTRKVMGANHKVNSPKLVTIFLDDDGAVLVKPKKAFRLN